MESYIKINNCKTYHLDKFLKDSNILLITGLSGAGKTTLSKKIGEELKKHTEKEIVVCELDKELGIFFGDHSTDENYQILIDYINKCKKDKECIYIIEGVHIWLLEYYDAFLDPLIILDTNYIKCMYNVWKRSGRKIVNSQKIKQYIKKCYNSKKVFNRYKKIVEVVNL